MTQLRVKRPTNLLKDAAADAAVIFELDIGDRLSLSGAPRGQFDEVIFTARDGTNHPGFVFHDDCEEVGDRPRPELDEGGFVLRCLDVELTINDDKSTAPWFIVADYLIARAVIETQIQNAGTQIKNAGQMIPGSDAVGPLQVSSEEWRRFLDEGKPFNDGFNEQMRDHPIHQIWGAAYSMHHDAKAISELQERAGVATPADPFLPSYLDVFHAYLTGSPDAAVAILNAQKSEQDKAKPISQVLKGPLNDDQIAALFNARGSFVGTSGQPNSVVQFVAETEKSLTDGFQLALEKIKTFAPEALQNIAGGKAPWFDVAKEEEAKNIHEPDDLEHILHYFDATNFHPHTRAAWCGAFVAHCLAESKSDLAKASIVKDAQTAANWKEWGMGLPPGTREVPVGAVVVLSPFEDTGSTGHVGFFVKFADDRKTVTLLGGNQHKAVNEKDFPISHLLDIRWLNAEAVFESLVPGGFFSSPDQGGPRSIRCNNPGALDFSPWQAKRKGYLGKTQPDTSADKNETTIYRTPEHGVAAWYHLLSEKYGFGAIGQFTLTELAHEYAGDPTSDLVHKYLTAWPQLSHNMLTPTSVIDINDIQKMLVLARAMFHNEAGVESPLHDDQIQFAIRKEQDGTLPA